MALLIDASNVQGWINWAKVARAHVWGGWIKASEGVTFVDPRFEHNRSYGHEVGLHLGPYHFARPDHNSPVAEALHFAGVVEALRVGELLPALDYEVQTSLSTRQQAQWIRDFNHQVRRQLKAWPMFYTFTALANELHLPVPVGDGAWIADFGRNDGREHAFRIPRPWRKVVVHQFTSNGHIDGIVGAVDLDDAKHPGALLAHPVRGTLHRPIAHVRRRRSV